LVEGEPDYECNPKYAGDGQWAKHAERRTANPYFTPPEVAETLRGDQMKVHGWIRKGELRAVNVASSGTIRPRWRISQADLADFLAGRTAAPQPPVSRRKQRPGVTEYFK
jgi:hypothetical protein